LLIQSSNRLRSGFYLVCFVAHAFLILSYSSPA